MQNTIYIILILALTSCSNRFSSDLEQMNLNGSIKSILEEKHNSAGELIMSKETIFANSGMVKSTDYFYPESKISNKSINHYDYRKRIKKQEFIMNDSLVSYQDFFFITPIKDSIRGYSSNGELTYYGYIYYDNFRQSINVQGFSKEKQLIYCDSSVYDSQNRLKEIISKNLDSDLEIEYRYTYNYDSEGRVNKCFTSNSANNSISTEEFTYKNDEMSNWIEKQILSEGKLKAIVTRKIEYK